jgi:Ca2+/Na+ antiporter
VIAALRGERDIAVGHAVGSNIFNLVVLGVSSFRTAMLYAVAPVTVVTLGFVTWRGFRYHQQIKRKG